jgi:integrase/recombinase XerC
MHPTTGRTDVSGTSVTSLVTIRARENSAGSGSAAGGSPQPHEGERAPVTLPALRPEAAAALDVEPRELIGRWLAGLSENSRATYGRALRRFASWALVDDARPERALELLCALDAGRAGELVRRWRADLEAAGLAPGSVGTYLTSLTSLVGAARRAGLVGWRLEGVLPRYEPRCDRRGPRRGDVERLLALLDERAAQGDPFAVRDGALVRALYVGALRRGEAAGLRVVDFDANGPNGPQLRPLRKGAKERRSVLVSERVANAIAAWLRVRGDAPGPLFCRIRGREPEPTRLHGETIRRIVASWARRAGIAAPCRPHGLRHSSASWVAQRGSLAELLALGQWRSLSAAKRYLDEHDNERASALRIVDV